MKTYLKSVFTSLLVVGSLNLTYCQPGGGGFGDPVDVPIDGGISFLVSAGVIYGAKKLRDVKRKHRNKGDHKASV